MPQNQYTIAFLNDENKSQYSQQVYDWLSTDFEKLGCPGRHFFHNIAIITKAFDDCSGLVVLNKEKKVIGYMIWDINRCRAEIDIVEVKKAYRRKGIFKQMIKELCDKFPNIYCLSASVIPEAEEIFANLGYREAKSLYGQKLKMFYKLTRNVTEKKNILSDEGLVIAICREDFYLVQGNSDKYKDLMQYYSATVLPDKGLQNTIIIEGFHPDNYMGIYFNKKLICEGKPKHLLDEDVCYPQIQLLIINHIHPLNHDLKKIEKNYVSSSQTIISFSSTEKEISTKLVDKKRNASTLTDVASSSQSGTKKLCLQSSIFTQPPPTKDKNENITVKNSTPRPN